LNPHARWARPSEDRVSACSTTWPISSPYGDRTRVAGLRGRNPEPLDERAMSVRRAGVEPAQQSRAGYSRLGSPVPSRHKLSVFPAGVEPAPRPSEGRMPPLHLGNVLNQWTAGESHPDFRHAAAASSSWTSSPCYRPGGRRVNDGACTHLHRLHRPAAHYIAFIHQEGPRRASVPEAGFEPASSCSRSRRDSPLRHSEIIQAGEQGIEPRLPG
jgi:hypothetical protein